MKNKESTLTSITCLLVLVFVAIMWHTQTEIQKEVKSIHKINLLLEDRALAQITEVNNAKIGRRVDKRNSSYLIVLQKRLMRSQKRLTESLNNHD